MGHPCTAVRWVAPTPVWCRPKGQGVTQNKSLSCLPLLRGLKLCQVGWDVTIMSFLYGAEQNLAKHEGQAGILAVLKAHSGQQLASADVLGSLGEGKQKRVLADIVIFFQKCSEEKHQNTDSCSQCWTTLSGERAGVAETQKYSYLCLPQFWWCLHQLQAWDNWVLHSFLTLTRKNGFLQVFTFLKLLPSFFIKTLFLCVCFCFSLLLKQMLWCSF